MPDKRFKPKRKPSRARNHVLTLGLFVLLIIGSVILFMPPGETIRQGLDVQGGLSVVLEARKPDGSNPSADELAAARRIVERRVNLLGASEASVQVQGANQLLVQIPGIVDQTQALATIGQTGVLEFVDVSAVDDETLAEQLSLWAWYRLTDQDINEMLAFEEIYTWQLINVEISEQTHRVPQGMYIIEDNGIYIRRIVLEPGTYTPIFTGQDITNVSVGLKDGIGPDYSVNLTLNAEAAQAFGEVTTQLAPTRGSIAIVIDGAIQSAPAVQSPITTGDVSITGGYTIEDANSLRTILQSGSLPVSFTVINAQVIGPTMGQETLMSGILVALIGLALVAIYLLVFYRGIGLLTAASIFMFALLYLGVLALLSLLGFFALSLAGIAGIVLSIGVAADSSILILERFKEEIRMGRSVNASSVTGVKHAIITSVDADLVTLISALALFFIAVGSVKGFGLTLALGVVCDILVMLLFKAPLIRLLAPRVIARHPGFWGIKEDEELAFASGELNRGVLTHG